MLQSPGFSDFRQLMDLWDNICFNEEADNKSKVKMLLDGNNLIMFFLKDNICYGAPEESRLTFARMKHPNREDMDLTDAHFIAINLNDALVGKSTETMFKKSDLKKIKIISQEKCQKILEKEISKHGKKKTAKIGNVDDRQEDDGRQLQQED